MTENIEIIDLREQFFKVSNRILDEDLGLDIYEIGIYTVLCRFTNNTSKESFPSISFIQKITKLSRPKVINTIKSLVEKRVIIKKQGFTGKSNRYFLVSLPSKRDLLVNEIYQPSKQCLPEVVNDVYPKKTNIKKLNKKDLKAVFSFSLDDAWDLSLNVAKNGGSGYSKLPDIIKQTLEISGGLSVLRLGNSFQVSQFKKDFYKNFNKLS